jgi:hypothetical protein
VDANSVGYSLGLSLSIHDFLHSRCNEKRQFSGLRPCQKQDNITIGSTAEELETGEEIVTFFDVAEPTSLGCKRRVSGYGFAISDIAATRSFRHPLGRNPIVLTSDKTSVELMKGMIWRHTRKLMAH